MSAAKQYRDQALAHLKANSASPILIEPDLHPREWRQWQDYFEHVGMKFSASEMRTARNWTVPELSPLDFNPHVAEQAIAAAETRRANTKMARGMSPEHRRDIAVKARRMFMPMARARGQDGAESFDERMERLRQETLEVVKDYRRPTEQPQQQAAE